MDGYLRPPRVPAHAANRALLPMCARVVVMRMIGSCPVRLGFVRGQVYWIAFAHQPSGARSTRSHRGA